MKLLSSVLLTAFIASAKDGTSCVDSALVKVYNGINDIRKVGKESIWAKDYQNLTKESTGDLEGKWLMRQNNANPEAVFKTQVIKALRRIEESN